MSEPKIDQIAHTHTHTLLGCLNRAGVKGKGEVEGWMALELREDEKGGGASLSPLPASFSLPLRVDEGGDRDVRSACVCGFGGMICCCSCQKSLYSRGTSSQPSTVSLWKFCVCSSACVCALFGAESWFLPVFER